MNTYLKEVLRYIPLHTVPDERMSVFTYGPFQFAKKVVQFPHGEQLPSFGVTPADRVDVYMKVKFVLKSAPTKYVWVILVQIVLFKVTLKLKRCTMIFEEREEANEMQKAVSR